MKDMSIRELMTQMGERDLQEGHDQFVQKHIDRERQKREQQKRDGEASNAETARQPVESPA